MAVTLLYDAAQVVIYEGPTDTTTRYCRSCSTDYCDSGFAYNIYTFYSSGVWYPTSFQVGYTKNISNACMGPQAVQMLWDAFSVIGNSFRVTAFDGSGGYTDLLNTGCVTGSGSSTATIPAGTVRLAMEVISACNTTGGDQFAFLVQCV